MDNKELQKAVNIPNIIMNMFKSRILLFQALFFVGLSLFAQTSGFKELDEWTEKWKTGQQTYFGYPVNQQVSDARFL